MAGPGLALAVRQTIELARRSVLTERRQLLNVLPGLVFPLLLAAVYSRQFSRALAMPGFPEVDSFLDSSSPHASSRPSRSAPRPPVPSWPWTSRTASSIA